MSWTFYLAIVRAETVSEDRGAAVSVIRTSCSSVATPGRQSALEDRPDGVVARRRPRQPSTLTHVASGCRHQPAPGRVTRNIRLLKVAANAIQLSQTTGAPAAAMK